MAFIDIRLNVSLARALAQSTRDNNNMENYLKLALAAERVTNWVDN